MQLSILFFPLISFVCCICFGHKIGHKGATFVSTFFIFSSFVLSLFNLFEVIITGEITSINLIPWINSGYINLQWSFFFDSLTNLILVVVTSISSLVHLYSISYMSGDPHQSRFISYLSFFTFFIIVLVTADNFIQIFIGWEGVGLCSFLLINFWYTRIQANKAAIKAMLVNRVGDFCLIIGALLLYNEFGTLNYNLLFNLVPFALNKTFIFINYEFLLINLATLFLFLGAIGKSAQLGLHTWLPDAIEGPTPVSALIHAATIVTAGVFLLVRCSSIFEYSPQTLWFITLIGGLTAFFAATTGFLQHDLKKVIAYSTCSQLGYIIFSCGTSAYDVGFFHLANHAFFKALLFLTAGCVIHSINDEQDIRKIGGLVKLLPLSYSIMVIGSISLIGFPFLTGFYSKDVILEISFATFSINGHFSYWLGTISAFFTAFYSMRLIHLTFLSAPKGFKKNYENIHESDYFITIPLIILCFGSIFFGFVIKDFVIGVGNSSFNGSIFFHPSHYHIFDAEFLPTSVKLIPVVFSMTGIISSFIIYTFFQKNITQIKLNTFGNFVFIFFNRKWFIDKIYNETLNQNISSSSYNNIYKLVDKGIIEYFGPFGLTFTMYSNSKRINKLQTGQIYHYSLIITLGIILFIIGFIFCIEPTIVFNSFDYRLLFFVLFFFRVYSSVDRAESF